jgi:endonuclease G
MLLALQQNRFQVMLRFILCIFIVLVSLSAQSQESEENITQLNQRLTELDDEKREILVQLEDHYAGWIRSELDQIGTPSLSSSETVLHHSAWSFVYSEEHEQAKWVMHMVIPQVAFSGAGRTNDFRKDDLVKTETASKSDYWHSGYDRGHLAPSADFRWSSKMVSESYFYSNMSPQKPELNRQTWAKLEDWVRKYAVSFQEPVVVVTGPILKDGLEKLGDNGLSIPEQYFKIILDISGDEQKGIAFLMKNAVNDKDLTSYAVSINEVEKLSGIDFFPSLEDTKEERLESMADPTQWIHESDPSFGEVLTIPAPMPKGLFNTEQAKYQIDKKATICGTVVSSKKSRKEAIYLNFDRKYPNSPFYATIWKSNQNNFSYDPEKEFMNKKICVRGKITEYNGMPRMSINNEDQIYFYDELIK